MKHEESATGHYIHSEHYPACLFSYSSPKKEKKNIHSPLVSNLYEFLSSAERRYSEECC